MYDCEGQMNDNEICVWDVAKTYDDMWATDCDQLEEEIPKDRVCPNCGKRIWTKESKS